MSYYAIVKKNKVVSVIRAEADVIEEFKKMEPHKEFVQTSYNTRGGVHYDPVTNMPSKDQSKALRKNFAGLGFDYNRELDSFVPPSPFPSWTLDEATCLWEAPVPMPNDGKGYVWDEGSGSWKEASAS